MEPTTPPPAPQPPAPIAKKSPKKSSRHDLLSTIGIVIAAPIIALLLTVFVFQSYEVDGESMETTLQNKDRLIVIKTAKTWAKLTGHSYIPARYNIIVFNLNETEGGITTKKQLIKRVIGLPGDRVVVSGGKVTVYNATHPQGFAVDQEGPEAGVIVTTPNEINQTVGPDEVFVMGDNRENSRDSRMFGAVPARDIVGRLALRILPLSHKGTF